MSGLAKIERADRSVWEDLASDPVVLSAEKVKLHAKNLQSKISPSYITNIESTKPKVETQRLKDKAGITNVFTLTVRGANDFALQRELEIAGEEKDRPWEQFNVAITEKGARISYASSGVYNQKTDKVERLVDSSTAIARAEMMTQRWKDLRLLNRSQRNKKTLEEGEVVSTLENAARPIVSLLLNVSSTLENCTLPQVRDAVYNYYSKEDEFIKFRVGDEEYCIDWYSEKNHLTASIKRKKIDSQNVWEESEIKILNLHAGCARQYLFSHKSGGVYFGVDGKDAGLIPPTTSTALARTEILVTRLGDVLLGKPKETISRKA